MGVGVGVFRRRNSFWKGLESEEWLGNVSWMFCVRRSWIGRLEFLGMVLNFSLRSRDFGVYMMGVVLMVDLR